MPNADTVPTVTAAMTAAQRLADLRRAYGQAAAEVLVAERELAYARARAEQFTIDRAAAGDEKKLGPNEDARRRAFTLALETDAVYVDARTALADAEADRRLFDADMRLAQDQLTILVAALQAGLTDVAVAADNPVDDAVRPVDIIWVAPAAEVNA